MELEEDDDLKIFDLKIQGISTQVGKRKSGSKIECICKAYAFAFSEKKIKNLTLTSGIVAGLNMWWLKLLKSVQHFYNDNGDW